MKERHPVGIDIDNTADKKVNKARLISMVLIFILSIIALLRWCFSLISMPTTNDAYTSGHEVSISSQVSGRVMIVGPSRTDLVKKGDVLVRVDNADALNRYQNAKNKLAQALKTTKEHYVIVCPNDTNIINAQMAYQQALSDYNRRVQSQDVSSMSSADLQHTLKKVNSTKGLLDMAILKYQRQQQSLQTASIAQQQAILLATEELREARVALGHTEVRSPVTGYVVHRHVHAGVTIHPGQILLSIVPADQIWVNANFSATQRSHILIGQKASIITDQYGSKVIFEGQVEGVSLASDTVPPALAEKSSNDLLWIPVRISIDPVQMSQYPLRIGLATQVMLHNDQFHLAAY